MTHGEQRYYTNKNCRKFVKDMQEAGYETYHYRGRFFYEGPAVDTVDGNLQEILRKTTVKVQWDQMGLENVVYPMSSDKGQEIDSEHDSSDYYDDEGETED